MKPKIYDITPKISPQLQVFPGDQPFEHKVSLAFERGDHLALSSIAGTVHLGAHADAPSHYHANGESIERRPLARYMGPAQVVRVTGLQPKARIRELSVVVQAPRVLVDSCSCPDPNVWNPDFNSFAPELLAELADQGVRLIGIDTPSVDPVDSKKLESHQVLYQRDLAVLEGLKLKDVPEGLYTLMALPLPLVGVEASPVRAVLIEGLQDFPELE